MQSVIGDIFVIRYHYSIRLQYTTSRRLSHTPREQQLDGIMLPYSPLASSAGLLPVLTVSLGPWLPSTPVMPVAITARIRVPPAHPRSTLPPFLCRHLVSAVATEEGAAYGPKTGEECIAEDGPPSRAQEGVDVALARVLAA